jgi:FKBP-type peptidyl-prolyl cis-trans isomerase FklB
MKYSVLFALAAFFVLSGNVSAQKEKTKKPKGKKVVLKNASDSLSYCIGTAVMKNITDQGVENLNMDAIMQGFKDVQSKTSVISVDEANLYVNDYFMKQYTAKAEKDKGKQMQWLEENKGKEGVKVTSSGLQYKVLTAGTGPVPTEKNTVKVHYKGTLIDGTTFDSSYDRGEPIEFAVTGVIKGWVEALLMMPKGSKWELYIPSDLAYGEKGAGGSIPPYATLIFVVELLDIK